MADEDGTNLSGGTTNSELQQRQQYDARVKFIDGGRDAAGMIDWCDGKWPATVANMVAAIVAVVIVWLLLHVEMPSNLMVVPGGSLSSIFMVYVAGTVAGILITKIGGLPPLLGMMLAGIALRNTGFYTVDGWCFQLVATMR